MADIQISCINKPDRNSPHDKITHVGGFGWKRTLSQAVADIENKINTYYTLVNGRRAEVGVINGTNGKYLRTHADGQWNDNLLALPECP